MTVAGSFETAVIECMDRPKTASELLADVSAKLERKVILPQLHTSLLKLEKRGVVRSSIRPPEPIRGGRRRKVFAMTKEE